MITPLKKIEKKKLKTLKTQIPHLYKGEGRPTMLLLFIITSCLVISSST